MTARPARAIAAAAYRRTLTSTLSPGTGRNAREYAHVRAQFGIGAAYQQCLEVVAVPSVKPIFPYALLSRHPAEIGPCVTSKPLLRRFQGRWSAKSQAPLVSPRAAWQLVKVLLDRHSSALSTTDAMRARAGVPTATAQHTCFRGEMQRISQRESGETQILDFQSESHILGRMTTRLSSHAQVSLSPPPGIESQIGEVGKRLGNAFRTLIDAMPDGPHRPRDLARTLGIKKDLSSRVLRASRNRDPLAVVHMMPGPAPLRQLLQAIAEKGVPRDILREAEEAVQQFDQLIHHQAGDRTSLNAIISTCLPDAREKYELFNKQAVYRGMAQLKGAAVDVTLNTALVHPGKVPDRFDGLWIIGSLGLHRIRPTAVVHYCSRRLGPNPSLGCPLTLDRQEVVGLHGLLLEPYCSRPLPILDAQEQGNAVHYTLAGNSVGPPSAVDLLLAEFTPGSTPRYRDQPTPKRCGLSAEVTTPTKMLIFDLLVHETVFPGADPELLIYDTAVNGAADPNDVTREIDRLDLKETIERLGKGVAKCRTPEVPQYVEILRYACDKLGWDEREFRGYRCRVQYPVYGAQFSMAFTPPVRP